jgi:uncharacterized protein
MNAPTRRSRAIRLPVLALTLAVIAGLTVAGFRFAEIDGDVTRFLPRKDPVLRDAGYIFARHPIQDRLVIDLGLPEADPDRLVRAAERVETRLAESGLFREVGMGDMRDRFPDLLEHVAENLPVLLSRDDLREQVGPRLEPTAIRRRMAETRDALSGLDGIGQATLLPRDPLALREIVMARLARLAPATDVRFHKGRLLSADGAHLLIVATPAGSGTDTSFARKLSVRFDEIAAELAAEAGNAAPPIRLTPVGAFRSALDNETIARRDVTRAIALATLGIAVLLVLAFSRPLVGLLAFLPALAGTAAAFFALSLSREPLSLMALGFGGAIISITVDHGIAYLLFLDRPHETRGADAAREIRSVGLLTTLTTMGAFGALLLGDFPIFRQLGAFTALGIGFSFVFVHTVFPALFPVMPAAKPRTPILGRIASRLSRTGKPGLWAAVALFLILLPFARPRFEVSLSAMNTVSRGTAEAEALLEAVWGGGIYRNIHLMTEAETLPALQDRWDRLMETVSADLESGALESGFLPAMIFPGAALRGENLTAWRDFWTPERIAETRAAMAKAAEEFGFRPDGFEPFFRTLSGAFVSPYSGGVPEGFFEMLGIRKADEQGGWVQFSTLTPGETHDPDRFHARYGTEARIFDPALFSERLGAILFAGFQRMLAGVGLCVAALLLVFFLDWRLTSVALAPSIFALVCTLGTLNLAGHPLDLPGLMLAIVVFGMGIDYSLYTVRAWQRYGDPDHPSLARIRLAVFMAAVSTLIGFGVLVFSEHAMLRSAGITSLSGIAFSLAGAFLLLPPLLGRMFADRDAKDSPRTGGDAADPDRIRDRVLARFRRLEAYPRLFARFKMRLDPMFEELPKLLEGFGPIRTVLDIGCGYGVPAAWMLERFPDCRIVGIDPDAERVRVAGRVLGNRGRATSGAAPELPRLSEPADLVAILDILHFLDDGSVVRTLEETKDRLRPGGILAIRSVVPPPDGRHSRTWRWEGAKLRFRGISAHYRSPERIAEMLASAGFSLEHSGPSGGNPESSWFVARNLG